MGTFKNLIAESVMGFVWWSTFVEFLSTLWFFPLEKMDFSGILSSSFSFLHIVYISFAAYAACEANII